MGYHTRIAEKCGNPYFGFLLAFESSLCILRLFLSFSDSLELSREGFSLALGKVYRRLFLIDLDCPGL